MHLGPYKFFFSFLTLIKLNKAEARSPYQLNDGTFSEKDGHYSQSARRYVTVREGGQYEEARSEDLED